MASEASSFEQVPELSSSMTAAQCVVVGDEILMCGSYRNVQCASFHTTKDQYRVVCQYEDYPEEVPLWGHVVIRYEYLKEPESDKKEETPTATLLSFGGCHSQSHSLILKYYTVWDKVDYDEDSDDNKNKWIEAPKRVGASNYDLRYARALVDEANNRLFLIHKPNRVDILNLETFETTAKGYFPFEQTLLGSCFVKVSNEMAFFYENYGHYVQYPDGLFQFPKIPACPILRTFSNYGYVATDDKVLLFGGYDNGKFSDKVCIYFTKDKVWKEFKQKMPRKLSGITAIFDKNNKWIHLIGGLDGKQVTKQHLKIKLDDLLKESNLRLIGENEQPVQEEEKEEKKKSNLN